MSAAASCQGAQQQSAASRRAQLAAAAQRPRWHGPACSWHKGCMSWHGGPALLLSRQQCPSPHPQARVQAAPVMAGTAGRGARLHPRVGRGVRCGGLLVIVQVWVVLEHPRRSRRAGRQRVDQLGHHHQVAPQHQDGPCAGAHSSSGPPVADQWAPQGLGGISCAAAATAGALGVWQTQEQRSWQQWAGTCVAGRPAVVGGGEQRDEVPLCKALKAVHDALVRAHDHLRTPHASGCVRSVASWCCPARLGRCVLRPRAWTQSGTQEPRATCWAGPGQC